MSQPGAEGGDRLDAPHDGSVTGASRGDAAAQAGRFAGRLVGRLGARLLRVKPVREAVRRGHEEATSEAGPSDEPA